MCNNCIIFYNLYYDCGFCTHCVDVELSSSDSQVSGSDKELDSANDEDKDEKFVDGALAESEFVSAFVPAKPRSPTAEEILFPVEGEGSSEEEESDWIVSSDEEEGEEFEEDMRTVLAQLKRAPQPILYHMEAGCKETDDFILDQEEEEDGDSLLEGEIQLTLHQVLTGCGEKREEGVEGGRGERLAEMDQEDEDEREEGIGEGVREDKEDEQGGREDEQGEEESSVQSTMAGRLRQLLPKMKDQLDRVDLRGEFVCTCTSL